MITPRWVETRSQPIALDDVVVYLTGVLGRAEAIGRSYEIGGPEVMTYRDLMSTVARILHRRLFVLPVPLLSPRLSSQWLRLVTDVDLTTARALVDSMTNEVVVHDRSIDALRAARTDAVRGGRDARGPLVAASGSRRPKPARVRSDDPTVNGTEPQRPPPCRIASPASSQWRHPDRGDAAPLRHAAGSPRVDVVHRARLLGRGDVDRRRFSLRSDPDPTCGSARHRPCGGNGGRGGDPGLRRVRRRLSRRRTTTRSVGCARQRPRQGRRRNRPRSCS